MVFPKGLAFQSHDKFSLCHNYIQFLLFSRFASLLTVLLERYRAHFLTDINIFLYDIYSLSFVFTDKNTNLSAGVLI